MSIDGKRIGLALSGGGYRAAAYHIGTLRALHKLGILDKVDVLSSVSGGSITSAYYVQNKEKGYETFEKEFISKLVHGVLCCAITEFLVILALCFTSLILCGYWAILTLAVFLFIFWYYLFPISYFIKRAYDKVFFKGISLDEMPQEPILAINATDLSTGNQFTFSQDRMTCYPYKNKLAFNTVGFPVAKAVMASSCIPQIFSPIKLSDKYAKGENKTKPLLVDGGIYDNQGAHKFDSSDDFFAVDYAIVSDAGNTTISSKRCINPIMTLLTTADILMRRIKNFQRQHNSYIPEYKKKTLYAYTDLMWTAYDDFPIRFVKNIKAGYIHQSVLDAHGITNDMLLRLKNKNKSDEAFNEILCLVEKNIGWEEFLQRKPKRQEIAAKVGTNLIGLKMKQINALIEHSEWMTEVQVRMHLPFLAK